ncbi:hypothetical protein FSP39_021844 [Pinctada imbricata]|uniref:Zinc finger PHD-type domain-containing protein n=1 Tax=Pinctada imbricata TaxID=66713 RepID=A0AA88YF85_PINIB|nr:hypothetical protein FSP39_021844 [Pinctada imbricata]
MADEVFKAPKKRKALVKGGFEPPGSTGPRRRKTKEDFYAFCTMILEYTQYESTRRDEIRSQHNLSPLNSSGSTAESYTSDTTLSAGSPSHNSSAADLNDSDEDSQVQNFSDDESHDLITCFCMKPYAGRPMIECSECETWIHLSCAKIRKNNIPDTYVCQLCKDSKFTARKSGRVRTENNKLSL